MWIVGLLLGLIIGGASAGFEGVVVGSLLGAAIGAGFGSLMRRQDEAARRDTVEVRLQRLEAAVERLQARLKAIQDSPGALSRTAPETLATEASKASYTSIDPTLATSDSPVSEPPPVSAPVPVAVSEPQFGSNGSAAPPPETMAPRERPDEPSLIWRWFMGGNTVVRVGVVVLFFGVAFLLKYAYDHTYIPIEARVTGVALAAMVLLVFGWRLRQRRPGYALALQGGAVGLLYLTVFAALRLYHLLAPEAAFVLLFLIAALSAALAVMQNAQSMAALGAAGGFLAPILASTGSGSHVGLFSYYTMLNLGIVGIAWFKAWRPLNVLGFAFTFVIGGMWGAKFYRPEFYATTQPFLAIFFLLYLAIPVLFARRQAPQLKRYVDGTLVFGTPLVAFGLQTQLVRHYEYGAAWSAVVLALVYLVLASWLLARQRGAQRMLVEAFLALGVVFGTLAIPLALDGRWTSAAWALEGAAILWVGVRQQRWLARVFGIFLQIAAGLAFFTALDRGYADVPLLNAHFIGCLFIALAGFFTSWYMSRHRDLVHQPELAASHMMFVWALLWWSAAGVQEIARHVAPAYENHAVLLFAIASCLLFSLLHKALDWHAARYPALALLPVMVVLAVTDAVSERHAFAHLGGLAWPLAFAAHLWLLRRHDEDNRYLDYLHAAQVWLATALCAWEASWFASEIVQAGATWRQIAWAIVPAAVIALLATKAQRLPWPVNGRIPVYGLLATVPLALFLCLWIIIINAVSDGAAAPLPYVPVFNPVDIAQTAAWLCIVLWMRGLQRLELADPFGEHAHLSYATLGALAFIGLNGSLLRAIHHITATPYELDVMLSSMLVQAALSIFWSILAVLAMAIAARLRIRVLWFVGAALMAVVVVKLFIVDLSSVAGIERIVSFIGVGLLMLLIGYFSPIPPRTEEQA